MKSSLVWLTLLALVAAIHAGAMTAPTSGNKYALIIGNSDYAEAPLKNPVNDANDIAATLQELGFNVTKKINATQPEMEYAIRDFGQQVSPEDVALFYFSGHGVQNNGINYLLPVEAKIYAADEIKYKAVPAEMVLDKMEQAGSRVNIVILDACRNNPFRGFRSLSRGLASMTAPRGSYIAYSTAPGNVAFDGSEADRNSPYTKHLIRNIREPNMKIEDVFKKARIGVMSETGSKQIPWESSSLTGDFFFLEESRPSETPSQPREFDIPSLQADVIDLRFYESGAESVPRERRLYSMSFPKESARYINWELFITHEDFQRNERVDFEMNAVWTDPSGNVFTHQTTDSYLSPEWTSSWHGHGWGYDDPGYWGVGTYRVDIFIKSRKVASATYEIYESSGGGKF